MVAVQEAIPTNEPSWAYFDVGAFPRYAVSNILVCKCCLPSLAWFHLELCRLVIIIDFIVLLPLLRILILVAAIVCVDFSSAAPPSSTLGVRLGGFRFLDWFSECQWEVYIEGSVAYNFDEWEEVKNAVVDSV